MEHKAGIDDLIKNVVTEEGLDAPSAGFAGRVMVTVMEINPEVKAYKPLIPKYILAVIVAVLLLAFLFLSMSGYPLQATKIPYLDNLANVFKMPRWGISMPVEISYILASALIMLLAQVFVISRLYKKMHQ